MPVKKKRKKRISVAAAKAKGRRLQQDVARHISELINIPWGKDELIDSREMGQSGVDVKLIGEAKRKFPYSVEAKNQESWQVFAWLRQAQTNILKDTDWMLVCARNHFSSIVVIDRVVFEEVLAAMQDNDDNLIEESLQFDCAGEYELKSWKLPDWVTSTRLKYKHETRQWYLLCKRPDEFDVAVLDMESFFHMLEHIPGEIKR